MGIHDCIAWLGTRGRGPAPSRSPRGARYPILLALLALAAGLPGPAAAQVATANVSNVDFGPQPLGTTAERGIEIINTSSDPTAAGFLLVGSLCSTGPLPCLIGIDPSFTVVAQTCYETNLGTFVASYAIAPGGFCTITVEFTPTYVGNPGATLLVASNGSITPLAIAVSGDAVAPTTPVTITPSPLIFPPQPEGVPTTQYLTVTNTTKYQVTVNSVYVDGGNSPSFGASSVECGSLAPGGTCPVSVTFTPKTPNAPLLQTTVAIYVSSSSTSEANTASNHVIAQGSSLNATPLISLSPAYVNFEPAPLGSTTTQYVTIGNTGTAPLQIYSIVSAGDNIYSFFAGHPVTNNCFASVPVGGSCMITVPFTPNQLGLLTAAIIITTNSNEGFGDAGVGITRINLSGTGVANNAATTHLTVGPSITPFGLQPEGTTSTEEGLFLVNNTAAPFPLTSGSVTLGGNNPASFALKFNECTSTVAVGNGCSVVVTFSPEQGSAPPGTLLTANIYVNGYGNPFQGLLTGYGVKATQNLTVTPLAGLTFASQVYGTSSAPQTLTVTNTTNKTAVKVTSVTVGGGSGGSFPVTSLCGGYVSLAPGGTCTLNVTFQPQSAPASLSALLNVVGSVGGPSNTVNLNGASTAAHLPQVGGESLAKATADLTALGYEVESVTTAGSAKPAGQVLALVPGAAGGIYGAPVGLTVSAGAISPTELNTERALAQAGLSIGLASNLMQSQSWILMGLNDGVPECTPLAYSGNAGNVGSVWSQGIPSEVWVFSDGACNQPYILASATQLPNGEYSETATYYPLGTTLLQYEKGLATPVGTLTFTMNAQSLSGTINGIGTFAVSGGQTVQLGISCTEPAIGPLPCAGGIVQDFPGAVIGSLTPLTYDPLDSAGIGSSEYFASPGTLLTLTNPILTSPPFMDITGSSVSFESYSHYGAAGSNTVFPAPPTGWTVMDSTGTYQLQITESDTTGGFSLDMIAPNMNGVGVLSTGGTVDAAGNGTITYTDGTPATISNWILSDN
jgi:hypothetical protein